MSCSRPRGQYLRGRGQILRGRGRIIWSRGHTGLETLTSLIDISIYWSSLSQTSNRCWSADTEGANNSLGLLYSQHTWECSNILLWCNIQLSWLRPCHLVIHTISVYRKQIRRYGTVQLQWCMWQCGYPMVKIIEDMFSRFDRIPACDRRTDGQRDILRQHSPRYA